MDHEDLSAGDKLHAIVDAQFHRQVCSRKKLAVWFAFFGEASHRKAYRSSSSHIDIERQDVCTALCHEIIVEGGYTDLEAEDVALTLESLFDGFWLNMMMYPKKFTRESAVRRVLIYLHSVFPQHFG